MSMQQQAGASIDAPPHKRSLHGAVSNDIETACTETLTLGPFAHAKGAVQLPGSKSISNRVLLLAALAAGETRIHHLLDCEDTQMMRQALGMLGVPCVHEQESGACCVRGIYGHFPCTTPAALFLGNAGTVVRPLTAALAACGGGEYRLSGTDRMHQRPIGDLVTSLRSLGAVIEYAGEKGFLPLVVHPARLMLASPVCVRGETSSQFLTALLMILPYLPCTGGREKVIEVAGDLISKPYIDMTVALMAQFGVHLQREGYRRFMVPDGTRYCSPGEIRVEGDASSASYFLAAGAIGGGPVRVNGVGRASIQGDIAFARALAQMGAKVQTGDTWIQTGHAPLRAIDIDCGHIPDAAMTLAIVALFAQGTSTLRNIASWRVKETDRLAAMHAELCKLGADVEVGGDFLRITPPAHLKPNVQIRTYDDHRMAMCFSLVALRVPVIICDPACVRKTFPDYFQYFLTLVRP